MTRWLIFLVVAFATPAASEPLVPDYRCDAQTIDTALAFERAGDRQGLRDHVRSYGCKLIWPREAFEQFEPVRKQEEERR